LQRVIERAREESIPNRSQRKMERNALWRFYDKRFV
jgi:hypothetical protein